MKAKQKLLRLLYRDSFKYDPNKGFKLSCGKRSDRYFDCKQTSLSPEGLSLIGQVLWSEIKNLNIDAIGGLTLGADPLVCSTAIYAAQKGKSIGAFIVRKKTKKYGTQKWIEGKIKSGMRVIIVDDVVTTGNSTLEAIKRAEEAGLKVIKVVVLIDREEGGRENIEQKGYKYTSIFTYSDFVQLMKELKNERIVEKWSVRPEFDETQTALCR